MNIVLQETARICKLKYGKSHLHSIEYEIPLLTNCGVNPLGETKVSRVPGFLFPRSLGPSLLRLVGAGDMRLRNEFGKGDSAENQYGATGRHQGEALSHDDERRQPGEDRLHGEDEGRMRGGQDGLRPTLDGEGRGGGEDGGDGEGDEQARSPIDMRPLDEGQTYRHEQGAKPDLQQRERLKGDTRRDVSEGDAMKREGHRAAQGEHVAPVDGGKVGQDGSKPAGGRIG